MGFLPGMAERRSGHIVNISSIGVLTTLPRFSAYVASKAALEAWTDCAASEFLDRNVAFTNVNMPLVRTEMIAPSKFYEHVPTLDPDEAADLVVEALIHRPARVATRLGRFGQALHAVAPNMGRIRSQYGISHVLGKRRRARRQGGRGCADHRPDRVRATVKRGAPVTRKERVRWNGFG